MRKTKELIICIISIIALILAVTTNAFATEVPDIYSLAENTNASGDEFPEIPEDEDFEDEESTDDPEEVTNTADTTNTNTAITANTTNTNTNANTNSMPYTGVSYSSVVIIAICGISAIYAYKKIRDYNV